MAMVLFPELDIVPEKQSEQQIPKRKPRKKSLARNFKKHLNVYLGMPESGYKDTASRGALSIMKYIESDLLNLPHHKKTSRTYKRCFTLFKEMLEGTFVSKRRQLVVYVRAKKLPKEIQIRALSIREVKETLRRLNLYVKDTKLQTYSLLSLLYNQYSQANLVSLFLLLWDDRKWEAVEGERVKMIDSSECVKAVNLAGQYLGFDESDTYSWNRVQFYIAHMQNFYYILPDEDTDLAPYGFTYFCPNFLKFVIHYIHHLESCDWITFKSFNFFNVRSNFFKKYIDETWKKSDCGYKQTISEYLTEYIITAFISEQGQNETTGS